MGPADQPLFRVAGCGEALQLLVHLALGTGPDEVDRAALHVLHEPYGVHRSMLQQGQDRHGAEDRLAMVLDSTP